VLMLAFWMPLMIRDFGVKDVLLISLYSVIPNAIGAIGVILIARRADRVAGHTRFFVTCLLGGAVALVALTTHPSSLVLALALLSVATTLMLSGMPIFWSIATSQLPKETHATGIALVSSIGIISGVVGPWAIGAIKTSTGSMDNALYIQGGLLMLAACGMLALVRSHGAVK